MTIGVISAVFLYKYYLTAFAVCLGSLSCWGIKQFPIRCFPEGMAWWIKSCLYFSALMIPLIRTILPTPVAEMQPQTRTDPPPCFTEGRKHSVFHLSPTLLLTYCRRLDPNNSNLDLSLYNTLFHWSSFQSLWAFAYLSLFTLFPFLISDLLAATLPQRPVLIKLLQDVEAWHRLSTWHPNEAARYWARSLLDFLRSLKEETLINLFSLNNISWVTSLFADFPLRVAFLM